jgi:mRNA-degrading endonuclease RelE of RelBE toxin-antitoxin system
MTYEIVFTRAAEDDLKQLTTFDRNTILDAIEQHLSHQPAMESRSRIKKLIQPAISEYRLRVGDFRVYYDIEPDETRVVILHIWEKGGMTTPQGDL